MVVCTRFEGFDDGMSGVVGTDVKMSGFVGSDIDMSGFIGSDVEASGFVGSHAKNWMGCMCWWMGHGCRCWILIAHALMVLMVLDGS